MYYAGKTSACYKRKSASPVLNVLRHHNHYSSQQTKIYVETNPRPCAIIISPYNNYVLVIPNCHTDTEYLPSSESHTQNAHVSVILRKATISFMSVHPSVQIQILDSHWTDFHEIWYWSTFRNPIDKIPFSLKSDKNNKYFTRRSTYINDVISLIPS